MQTAEKTIPKKRPAAPELKLFEGYLFAKLQALGSKSEGPGYFLQFMDGKEIPIAKKAMLWMNDPVLHPCLGQKVALAGAINPVDDSDPRDGIHYAHLLNRTEPLQLGLELGLEEDTLWINKMPGPPPKYPPRMKSFAMKLSVQWPFRSIWRGECPSSQVFDFGIENPDGKTIWQWGNCMMFRTETTQVQIPGGSPKAVKVPWFYFEDSIMQEGLYVAKAEFIASGQVIRKPFWVEVVW